MPSNMVYVDPWLLLVLLLIAGIGIERLFIDVVRFVDKRWLRPRAKPTPRSAIVLLEESRKEQHS